MQKEFFRARNVETVINIVNTEIESLRKKEAIRKSARIFDNGSIGISASKADIPEQELEKKAHDALSLGVPVNYRLPEGSKGSWNTVKAEISDSELMSMTEKLIKQLKEKAPEFIFSNKVRYSVQDKNLTNSEGADYSLRQNSLGISLIIKKRGSGNIFDAFWGNEFFEMPDIDKFTDKMMEYLDAFDNPVDIEEGEHTVIFPGYEGTLPMSFFEKHINGELYEKGASFFKDSAGRKLFSEEFSLYDLNLDTDNCIASPFDAEGYVRKDSKLPIIENGEFKTVLYDIKRAAIFNRQPTGTSYRPYNGSTAIHSNFLWMPSCSRALKDIDRAIMIFISSGGDFQDNGSISMPVQLAYLVENGKITGRLPQMQANGSIDKMFSDGYIGALKDSMFDDIHKYFALKMNIKKG